MWEPSFLNKCADGRGVHVHVHTYEGTTSVSHRTVLSSLTVKMSPKMPRISLRSKHSCPSEVIIKPCIDLLATCALLARYELYIDVVVSVIHRSSPWPTGQGRRVTARGGGGGGSRPGPLFSPISQLGALGGP